MRTERFDAQGCRYRGSSRTFAAALAAGGLLLGLAASADAQLFTRGNVLLTSPDVAQNTGFATASGDFNCDGFADLAVGVPRTTVDSAPDAGEVLVWYGTPDGFTAAAAFHQGLNGLPGSPESGDGLGTSLAAGDFDGNGCDDLAVGVPYESLPSGSGPIQNAGVIDVLYGWTAIGLDAGGSMTFNQESPGIGGVVEAEDAFGSVLSAGDFNADGYFDLAIGTPQEDVGAQTDAGNLTILYGHAAGLIGIGSQTFNEAGAGGTVGAGNHFARALARGDFDADNHADLAVGVPDETITGHPSAGAVWIFSGVDGGLLVPGLFLRQGSVLASGTVAGQPETDDQFGASLAAGDFDRPNAQTAGYQDLAIGVIGENGLSGAVEILVGSLNGILAQGSFTFPETALVGTGTSIYFGWTLAAGFLHRGIREDLVVGSPFDDLGAPGSGGGRVFDIPGSSSGLQFGLATEFEGATPGLACGPPNSGESVGWALSVGDFDGRGVADLAIGIPGLNSDGGDIEGGVEVLWSALFASDFETHDLSQWSIAAP